MYASRRSKRAKTVEKIKNERRKATKAVVYQEKVLEENSVVLIEEKEAKRWGLGLRNNV